MGTGLAQQCDDLKAFRGLCPFGGFFFEKRGVIKNMLPNVYR